MKKLLMLVALSLALVALAIGCSKKSSGLDDSAGADARSAFLNDHVYFDFDRYDIRSDQVPKLQAKAAYLGVVSSNVEIQGHADERGSEAYNLALGDRRAKSARNYIVGIGVSSGRLSTISRGEEDPIDPGHNEAAWAKNRRAQFVLLN
jgi:peptidoglycan-associated lipoprotein